MPVRALVLFLSFLFVVGNTCVHAAAARSQLSGRTAAAAMRWEEMDGGLLITIKSGSEGESIRESRASENGSGVGSTRNLRWWTESYLSLER